MAIGLSDRKTRRASDLVCMALLLSGHSVTCMAIGLSASALAMSMHGPFAERSLCDVHGDWAERLVMIRAGAGEDARPSYSNPDLSRSLC